MEPSVGALETIEPAPESRMGMAVPMVLFKQLRKFISVPAGKGVSAVGGGASVLLSAGAFEGRFAVSLYEVNARANEEAR